MSDCKSIIEIKYHTAGKNGNKEGLKEWLNL